MPHNWVSTRWRRSARHENLLSMVSATTGGTRGVTVPNICFALFRWQFLIDIAPAARRVFFGRDCFAHPYCTEWTIRGGELNTIRSQKVTCFYGEALGHVGGWLRNWLAGIPALYSPIFKVTVDLGARSAHYQCPTENSPQDVCGDFFPDAYGLYKCKMPWRLYRQSPKSSLL